MALLALTLWSLAIPTAWGAHAIKPSAPEFPVDGFWINAKPLSLARLKGRRVTLVFGQPLFPHPQSCRFRDKRLDLHGLTLLIGLPQFAPLGHA